MWRLFSEAYETSKSLLLEDLQFCSDCNSCNEKKTSRRASPKNSIRPRVHSRVGYDQATTGMERMGLKRDWIHRSVDCSGD
jgi:hypothetical protein